MQDRDRNLSSEIPRFEQSVPGVSAEKSPDVNSEAARTRYESHEDPTRDQTETALHAGVHGAQGRDRQEKPRPGEGSEHPHVEPDGNPGARTQMDEVGDEIRRVREEQEPEGHEYPAPAWRAGIAREAQDPRDPRQRQIPQQECVQSACRPPHAPRQERHRQRRREGRGQHLLRPRCFPNPRHSSAIRGPRGIDSDSPADSSESPRSGDQSPVATTVFDSTIRTTARSGARVR